MLEVRGTEVLRTVVLPDSNHDRMELALQDFRRAATQLYRFRAAERLIAGRV